MNGREKYLVYCEMFERAHQLEDIVRNKLESSGCEVYHCEIHVGKEETREYICYIEYMGNNYKYINGTLMTEKQLLR